MKKILLLIILLLPISVNAEVKITNHLIDAEIEIAGGLKVKELIVLDGNLKDFSRTINYKMIDEIWNQKDVNLKGSSIYNGYSLENIKVSAISSAKEIDFNTFSNDIKNYIDELDPKGKDTSFYTNIKNNLGSTINIHYEGKEEKIAFYLEYVVSNVIVAHEDVLELNYTFKNLNIRADKTIIRVIIPYATNSSEYNYWIHGPASGSLNEVVTSTKEKIGVIGEFPKLKNEVNIRMTLPKEQVGIDIYLNKSKIKALTEILKIENSKLKKQSNDKTVLKVIKYALIIISIIYVLGSFILIKYHDKSIFLLYLLLGIILTTFNFIFKYHIIYLYFIILIPILNKVISLFNQKNKTLK